MTDQMTVPAEFTVNMPYGAGTLVIQGDKLSADILWRACQHGLTQKVGDLSSRKDITAKSPASAVRAACQKMVDAWYAGLWSTGRETDPLMQRVRQIAAKAVTKAYDKKHGAKWSEQETLKAAYQVKLTSHIADNLDSLKATAKAQLDAEAALPEVDID